MDGREWEMVALLALLRTRPRGTAWGSIAAEVLDNGSASELLSAGDGGLFRSAALDAAVSEATNDVTRWKAAGLQWLTVIDAAYPERLRDVREAPPFLFYQGGTRSGERGMSIVGSRAATDWGLGFAAEAARLLVGSDVSVLSGLAEGIDTVAHQTALELGGRTVAFLGTGITRSYPSTNRNLQAEIATRGLLLSQFYPDAAPTKQSFPMRNATMSGYGLATIVVEAGEHSGARIQARVAGQHGRPVVLTSRVVETTRWAAAMAERVNVRVVDDIADLANVISELQRLPERLHTALEAVFSA